MVWCPLSPLSGMASPPGLLTRPPARKPSTARCGGTAHATPPSPMEDLGACRGGRRPGPVARNPSSRGLLQGSPRSSPSPPPQNPNSKHRGEQVKKKKIQTKPNAMNHEPNRDRAPPRIVGGGARAHLRGNWRGGPSDREIRRRASSPRASPPPPPAAAAVASPLPPRRRRGGAAEAEAEASSLSPREEVEAEACVPSSCVFCLSLFLSLSLSFWGCNGLVCS